MKPDIRGAKPDIKLAAVYTARIYGPCIRSFSGSNLAFYAFY